MRQQAVLQSDDMDMREFQPFATVDGDERHGVTGGFLLILTLGIQHQIIEETLQTFQRVGGRGVEGCHEVI